MPSPFPGMDPYLEARWHDFHERFLTYAAAHIARQVLPAYIVLIDEHVYVRVVLWQEPRAAIRPDLAVTRRPRDVAAAVAPAAPAQVVVPELDEERESFLGVYDREGRRLVTVVELLSPTNKRPGDNRERYLAKRAEVTNSSAHLVEIDLLRCPRPMPAADRPPCTYSVLVSRAGRRPRAGFWPIGLRDPLPVVPIPLRDGEPDARLELRAVLDRVYDESGYAHFLYEADPDPPLTDDDLAWARGFLKPPPPPPRA
jgi:hypothetical protein